MRVLLLAAAALSLSAAAAPKDWSKTVADTPVGWSVGNPAAKAKLVEYASPNCPHCAHFSQAADAQIMAKVKSGKLQFEYRPYMIFPHDVAAALIARCVPAQRRPAFVHDYYANSKAVTERLRAAMTDGAQAEALKAARDKGMGEFNRKVASVGGMTAIAARHGLTPTTVNRCVADKAGTDWLQNAHAKAKSAGVTGTPTFLLNGKRLDVSSPQELIAALK